AGTLPSHLLETPQLVHAHADPAEHLQHLPDLRVGVALTGQHADTVLLKPVTQQYTTPDPMANAMLLGNR
ncbi:hypothetical protein, partial [Providencia stuartii]|uniref:hypothetical protein n=1 Tax=Providencia stuartii TaxID=588 RepID=UPI0013D1A1E9